MSDDASGTTAVPSTYEKLAAPFALSEHAKVRKGGMEQTYAPWTEYVERMNTVLGADKWSVRIIREGFTATECWVLAEVEAVIDDKLVVRQQYGCEPITKAGGSATADLLKSTASDAIKKAVSLLGPGLYLSVKEERVVIEQAMQEAVADAIRAKREAEHPKAPAPITPPRPTAPTSGAGVPSETELKRWERLVVEAERVKLPTLGAVKAIAPMGISTAQLAAYGNKLEASIAAFRRQQQGAA